MGLLLVLFLLVNGAAMAAEPMDYVLPNEESDNDRRSEYSRKILHEALERTLDRFGPYRMRIAAAPMNESRRVESLRRGNAEITVTMLPARAEIDDQLLPVRIPVDRGLLGYRLLLIRADDQPRFDAVKTLDDLRQFTFGLGAGWVDVPILEGAGLTVVQGGSYEGLFKMLAARRFDAYNRSASEIWQELEDRKHEIPGLAIERHLLLHYPLPAYFWFARSDQGRRLAERVRAGLDSMVADGTLEVMFDKQYAPLIAPLDLDHRTVIELPNPILGHHEPLRDVRLWYSTLTQSGHR